MTKDNATIRVYAAIAMALALLCFSHCARDLPDLTGLPCKAADACGPRLTCIAGKCRGEQIEEPPDNRDASTNEKPD